MYEYECGAIKDNTMGVRMPHDITHTKYTDCFSTPNTPNNVAHTVLRYFDCF